MLVTIYPPSRQKLKAINGQFALQQDTWNDYNYQTLYHLYYNTPGEDATLIGGVKILRKGQTQADGIQIKTSFSKLDENFCSVGTSLDYYQRLVALPSNVRREIVQALRDVAVHPELQQIYSQEPAWRRSLFRDNSDWKRFLDDAHGLYFNEFTSLVDVQEPFSFSIGEQSSDIEFDFSTNDSGLLFLLDRRIGPNKRKVQLPHRVMVLVGRNGSGKSTLLSRLAHVAFASPSERLSPHVRRLGAFRPEAIGFMRIVTVSYSAFDSFTIPGDREDTLSQTARDIEKGEGRFVYCGLRDVIDEARDDINRAKQVDEQEFKETMLRVEDRRTSTRLKSIDALADEFASLIGRIQSTDKKALLSLALEPILQDPSFSDMKEEALEDLSAAEAKELFLSWSTGHKIALHVIASLVTYTVPRSLVLFDEPEMHLHPPLAAALMHSVRLILEDANAVCVVATHSPVMLQETMARQVRVVNRNGESLHVKQPQMETFGESIGILTYDTFGLTASSSDFHQVLDLLVDSLHDITEIDKVFSPGLSSQARAYVLARLATKGKLA
ncbi:AAA family ATPase [Pseudorhodoferax sp. Leaf274]|uniref:AAA family ATPase n=1 Tax=Pseudorhodoferax sp. Leaf274 TaxID=1736318 RepID=UPI0009EB3BEE|nr:AAA family ATPase [Pseudorhodoferax sp. Leaf274]